MKRFLSLILAMLMVTALFVPSSAADIDTSDLPSKGRTFLSGICLTPVKNYESAPYTYEAVIRLPATYTLPSGVKDANGYIISNYRSTQVTNTVIALGFNTSSQLELLFASNGATVYYTFTTVTRESLGTDWVHIAVVKDDPNRKAYVYVNGECKQTLDTEAEAYGYLTSAGTSWPLNIGGDERRGAGKGNLNQAFTGEIAEIAVYSSARSGPDIAADASDIQYNEAMLAWYQLSDTTHDAPDLSGRGNHIGPRSGTTDTSPIDVSDYVTVKFKTGVEDMIVAPQVFGSGEKATDPKPPRDGYKLLGWYNGDTQWDFNTLVNDGNTVNGELTLTAEWEKKTYNVTFDMNLDGADASVVKDAPVNDTIEHGDKIPVPTPAPTRTDGYNFVAWLDADGEEFDFDNTPITEPITLTAKWVKEDQIPVVFKLNDTDTEPYATIYVDKNSQVLAPKKPEQNGYNFVAWLDADGEEFDFDNTPITETITLTAKWEIKTYEVTFDTNGASSTAPEKQTVEYGKKVTEPDDPTRDGYAFAGWYNDGEVWEFNTTLNDGNTVNNKLTLIAQWKEIFDVTFLSDGQPFAEVDVADGGAVNAPADDPTKTGYAFGGWALPNAPETPCEFPYTVTSDLTFSAIWAKDAYTVKFVNDGKETTKTVSYGDKVAQPENPIKTGYLFLGWFASESATTPYDFTAAVAGNLTLTARWEVDPDFNKGMTFADRTLYPLAKDFDQAPMTIEARVHIPADATIKSNTILFGNNDKGSTPNLIRIQFMGGYIRLVYKTNTGAARYVYFAISPTALKGKTFHIAVVTDFAQKEFRAYLTVDGVTTEYLGYSGTTSVPSNNKAVPEPYGYSASSAAAKTFYVGGDRYDNNNSNYFRYYLSEIAAYADVRTEAEIKADAAGITKADGDDMLVWLQLSEGLTGAEDLSGNGFHMGDYVDPNAPKPDPSENIFTTPLFALAALYAQRFDVLLIGENCSISGDTMIKYKRSGVVEISVDEGYELVDVMLDGKPLGPVTKVDIKKVTRNPELVVITRAVGAGE